jgi:hypothetical protein
MKLRNRKHFVKVLFLRHGFSTVAQAGLTHMIRLLQLSYCWHFRWAPSCPISMYFKFKGDCIIIHLDISRHYLQQKE